MVKIEFRELKPTEMNESKREKEYKSLAKNLNDLPIHENLDLLVLGSISFGVCKEGSDNIGKPYDSHNPIHIKKVDENRYLIKKGNGSLIDDLNLKTEWRCAVIKRFGTDFLGVACELAEPPNSFSYIY